MITIHNVSATKRILAQSGAVPEPLERKWIDHTMVPKRRKISAKEKGKREAYKYASEQGGME